MGLFSKRKLLSMLLMTAILATNLMLTQVILSASNTASIALKNVLESYQSYSEDGTVQESVYRELVEDSGAVPPDSETKPEDSQPGPENFEKRSEDPAEEAEEHGDARYNPSFDTVDAVQEEEFQRLEGDGTDAVRVVFLGDCMMADNMARALDKHGMEYTLEDFDALLRQADVIIANLETSIGTSRILMDKSFPFQSDPRYLSLFEPYRDKIVFSLANNHGMDAPLSETMEFLNDLNYAYIGVGENVQQAYAPHLVEINGISFAIFAASQVMPTTDWRAGNHKPGMAEAYNADKLISYIKPWMDKVDYTVAYIHWGEELANQPTANQLMLEKELRKAGVNVIIGSHPHVLQAFEWYGEKQFTAHSMGNFVFTTSRTPVANDTAALEMVINKDGIRQVQLHFGRIQFGKVHSLMEDRRSERIIERLNQLSHSVYVEDNGELTRLENWR